MNCNPTKSLLIPNVFDPSSYFDLDVRNGVLKNRFGTKCCTLSGHFLRGLYAALQNEAGPAWRLILRSCGENWGQRFSTRFMAEIGEFYGETSEEMNMARFDALVTEYFALNGWGRVTVDYRHLSAGLFEVEVANPILAEVLSIQEVRCDVLFEGVLKALYSKVTGQALECYETQTVAMGAPTSLFVLGLEDRLVDVPDWIEANEAHSTIINKLLDKKL